MRFTPHHQNFPLQADQNVGDDEDAYDAQLLLLQQQYEQLLELKMQTQRQKQTQLPPPNYLQSPQQTHQSPQVYQQSQQKSTTVFHDDLHARKSAV